MFIIPKKPLTISQVLSTGVSLWQNTFRAIVPFAAIIVLADFCYRLIIQTLLPEIFQITPSVEVAQIPISHRWVVFLAFIIYWVLLFIAHAGLVVKLYFLTQNQSMDLNHTLFIAFKKAFPAFVTTVVYAILTSLGLFLLIIPGLMIIVAFWLAPYIVVFTEKSIWESLKESLELVSKNGWHTAGVLGSVLLPLFVLSLVQQLLLKNWVGDLLMSVITLFTIPLVYSISMSLYYDLLVRKSQKVESLPSIEA